MKESYSEGLASHADPESCEVVRKDDPEALTGARAGRVLNRERPTPPQGGHSGVPTQIAPCGKATSTASLCEMPADLTRSETPRMYGNTSHGNRESRLSPAHKERRPHREV